MVNNGLRYVRGGPHDVPAQIRLVGINPCAFSPRKLRLPTRSLMRAAQEVVLAQPTHRLLRGRQFLPCALRDRAALRLHSPLVVSFPIRARRTRNLKKTLFAGVQGMQALTFFFAFVAVLALIGLAAWLVRRFAGNRLGANTNRGRMPRLAVIDAAAVDGRRRLVLVRRDNIEHLLMIGGPTDIVVEPNIVRAMPGRDQMPQRPAGAEPPPRIAPLPDTGWSDGNGARSDLRSDAFDHAEPQMPEPPPRPVRPSFVDEVRRPAPAMSDRRSDPLSGVTPEPLGSPPG